MHRDINPNNLAVTSFNEPKGLIIDLDAATKERHSIDHMQGTLPYLAPEIISLKSQHHYTGYDKSVDGWALGLSFYVMQAGQPVFWSYFAPRGQRPCEVTREIHSAFHFKVSHGKLSAPDARTAEYLDLIMEMTSYGAADRPSAADALRIAQEIRVKENSNGIIVLKSGRKRPREN